MKLRRILSLTIVLGMIMQAGAINGYAEEANTKKIYVNAASTSSSETGAQSRPYKTIEQAKISAVKNLNAGNNVEILIAPETYFLNEAVVFNSADFPTSDNSLVIRANDDNLNDDKTVIISGGKKLDNASFIVHDSTKNIYKIPYTGTIQRQLYVGGTPAVRARSTEATLPLTVVTNSNGKATAITTTNTAVKDWNLANVAEIVFKASYVSPRKFITGVTVENGVATFGLKYNISRLEIQHPITGDRGGIFHLENALEVLDEPGEWCHDGTYIYYMPREDEDINSVEIVLPKLESPVSFTGTAEKPIENEIVVENITFAHNTWMFPSLNGEVIEMQANVVQNWSDGVTLQDDVPGIVNTKYAQNIKFDGCTFTNGGGSGIDILAGSKNITLTNCKISNISSAGMLIGSIKNGNLGTDEASIVENIMVEQSEITNCAIDYRSATGVAVGYARDVKLVHNDIHNLPYTGIHVGWGWNNRSTSIIEGIEIKHNHIYDCMNEMHDGGLVYVMGPTNMDAGIRGERNEVAYNYLENVKSDGVYIYHDNGSSYWNTHHNVIYQADNTKRSWANTAPDTHAIAMHNNYTNITYETTTSRVNDWQLAEQVEDSYVYTMADGTPTMSSTAQYGAKAVIDNAGCKSTVLYGFEDAAATMTTDEVNFVGDDAVIKDGGSIDFGTNMMNKSLNFNMYAGSDTDGSYEISIDDKYTFTITNRGIVMYENGAEKARNNNAPGWSSTGSTDVTLTMTDSNVKVSYGNLVRINQNVAITNGRVKISVSGMDMAIGALARHYTFYNELLGAYDTDAAKNIAKNGYFETNYSDWTQSSASLSRDTTYAYGDSLGSLKVQESSTSGTPNTSVTLSGGKWYRVSAMVRTADGVAANSKTAKFTSTDFSTSLNNIWIHYEPNSGNYLTNYSSFFGKTFTLGSGWNKITDYIMVDSTTTVTLGIRVDSTSGASTDTYYVDNFEVVEEAPTLTESGFENGKGCWQSFANASLSITDNGYTGKALTVDTTSESAHGYSHAVRPIHLEDGKSYRARAKVYLESIDGVDTETLVNGEKPKFETMFSVHQYINYTTTTAMYGYQVKNIPTEKWVDFEFTFTWQASVKNAPAYLKVMVNEGKEKWRIDDVEIIELDVLKNSTRNSDFLNRMNDWEYENVSAMTFTAGDGVKVTSTDTPAKVYQDVYVEKDTDYYAEAFVKLDSAVSGGYALGNVQIEALDAKMTVEGDDFTVSENVATSEKQVLSHEKWTKVGGIINLSSDDTAASVHSRLSVNVLTDDGAAPVYSIKGLRLVPVSSFDTTLSDAAITDGAVEATGTGKIRYRYYKYNNGWTQTASGYVNSVSSLPEIGTGRAYALITTTAANGADELTEMAETAELTLLTATKTDTAISIKAAGNNPQNKEFILGIYSSDGKELKKVTIENGEYLNAQTSYDGVLENFEIKAFIWDMALLKPMCDALSVTTE